MKKARLIFADGREFNGRVFTSSQTDTTGEVVFNTGMSGYQEVLTDPSYSGQIVLMTYPLIGNYGINVEDHESHKIFLKGFIVREYCDFPSNWRSDISLKDFLDKHNVIGVEDFDTRAITKHVRESGAQNALLTTCEAPVEELLENLKKAPHMVGQNLAETVSTKDSYDWSGHHHPRLSYDPDGMNTPSTNKQTYKVAVIDCGIKWNILRQLEALGCDCHVYPTTVSADEILAQHYDGLFISNGPGDPEPVKSVVDTIQSLMGKLPMFGICLGHQLIGLALGATSYKLPFGHHGINHPVKDLRTGKVEITSQNHGFCIDDKTLSDDVQVTHINLNDGSLEGIRHKKHPIFSVQYHPEAAPGPHDSHYLFKEFIEMLQHAKDSKVSSVVENTHGV